MINAEKYRTEIQKIRKKDLKVGIGKCTGELFACDPYSDANLPCSSCLMHDGVRDCENALVDWLLEETPKYTLTKFEYLFLKHLNKKLKYIARAQFGQIILFKTEPTFSKADWDIIHGEYALSNIMLEHFFEFITWESGKYYSIKDLLEHSQVIENETV